LPISSLGLGLHLYLNLSEIVNYRLQNVCPTYLSAIHDIGSLLTMLTIASITH